MKQEKITAAELNKVAIPHCSNCGSSDLTCEAYATWDTQNQKWAVLGVAEDYCVCGHCGRDCSIKWRLS